MKVKQIVEAGWQSQKDFFSRLRTRKKLNDYAIKNDITQLYNLVHQEYEPIFVLSTGRCGTAFLTNLLHSEKSIEALHEPEPEFFYHTILAHKEYQTNAEKVKAVFDVARYELIRNVFINEKKYVETNNRVTFFAHQIAELYPKSKFIHLVRNPESFIKSGLGRNWYSGNSLYDEGRITNDADSWKSFSQIEKIAWLWNETNLFAEEFKTTISNDRFLFLKAEDLFKNTAHQLSVFDFVGVSKPSVTKLKRITAIKVNEGKSSLVSTEQIQKIKEEVLKLELRKKYNYD
jgi:hypothetical protein